MISCLGFLFFFVARLSQFEIQAPSVSFTWYARSRKQWRMQKSLEMLCMHAYRLMHYVHTTHTMYTVIHTLHTHIVCTLTHNIYIYYIHAHIHIIYEHACMHAQIYTHTHLHTEHTHLHTEHTSLITSHTHKYRFNFQGLVHSSDSQTIHVCIRI